MDITKFMIGDWVYSSFTEHPCKITHIGLFGDGYIEVGVTDVLGLKDAASLTPIPLTQEILEKNGIIYDYDDEFCVADYTYMKVKGYQYTEDNILIDYCNGRLEVINDITDSQITMDINYVHELQHALKICEIEKEIIL